MSENNEKSKAVINFSWWIPWTAGFMFFIGYTKFFDSAYMFNWFQQFCITIVAYFFWPLGLGNYLVR